MYNKRFMTFLLNEIKDGQHPYLKEVLDLLNRAAESNDEWDLKHAKFQLNRVIPELAKNDKAGWRRQFLINYYLNIELAFYKSLDESYTKWTVFRRIVEENGWDVILDFIDKVDQYITSPTTTEKVKSLATKEEFERIRNEYNEKVYPFIVENLDPVESFQARHRLEQRLNLLKKKIPREQTITFGEWMRQKREEQGMPLSKLGELTGYSASYIYRIETGKRKNPTQKVITRIIEALGYDPETILPMFVSEDYQGTGDDKKPIDVVEWLKFANYSLDGDPLPSEKKAILAEIVESLSDKEILRGQKMTELKKKIREFQR